LQIILQSGNNESILNKMAEFSSINDDVEYFIRSKAIDFEKRNACRTYLVFNNTDLIAYFTLSMKTLFFNDEVSKKKRKDIQGFTSEVSSVPVILIGQLSKNSAFSNKITGEELLKLCLNEVYNIQARIGGRFCLIETLVDESNKKVVDFYVKNGFNTLQKNEDETLYQMLRKLKN